MTALLEGRGGVAASTILGRQKDECPIEKGLSFSNWPLEEVLDSAIPVAQPSAAVSPYDVDYDEVVAVVAVASAAVFLAVPCVGLLGFFCSFAPHRQ